MCHLSKGLDRAQVFIWLKGADSRKLVVTDDQYEIRLSNTTFRDLMEGPHPSLSLPNQR